MGAAIALVRGQIALVQADGEQGSVVNHGVPNAKVQGRALGVAEANSGGGVPCNAQLGAGEMMSDCMRIDLPLGCCADELTWLPCVF